MPVDTIFPSKTGVESCEWSIYMSHVLIVGPGWQLYYSTPSSNIICDTGLYDGI